MFPQKAGPKTGLTKHIGFEMLLMTCIKKYFRSDYFGDPLSLSKAGLLKFSVFDKLRLTLHFDRLRLTLHFDKLRLTIQYDRTFVICKELKIYFMSASD